MAHEEEALGKAYDSRLMRRLLAYLRPYRGKVMLAIIITIALSVLGPLRPLLVMLAIDDLIAKDMPGHPAELRRERFSCQHDESQAAVAHGSGAEASVVHLADPHVGRKAARDAVPSKVVGDDSLPAQATGAEPTERDESGATPDRMARSQRPLLTPPRFAC